jgi:nucleotide-binding universal stress UspA family protein
MKKLLIAVDDTEDYRSVLSSFYTLKELPEQVILLHVQQLEGKSLMIDMLGVAEMETLKKAVAETEHKEKLQSRAEEVLNYFQNNLQDSRFSVKTLSRVGIPAEEILKVCKEEGVDFLLFGNGGRKGIDRLVSGNVTEDVKRKTKVPVLVAKNTRMINKSYGPLLFISFWSIIGIYYIYSALMNTIGRKLLSTSEGLPALVSYYALYLAVITVMGIVLAGIGGIFGRVIRFGRHNGRT